MAIVETSMQSLAGINGPNSVRLEQKEIPERLPHGPEFCFVDSLEYRMNAAGLHIAIGRLYITEKLCLGHFSREKGFRPIFPKVLGEEAAAQAGFLLLTILHPEVIGRAALFQGETVCKTFWPVLPCQTLVMHPRLISSEKELRENFTGTAACEAYVAGRLAFSTTFSFSLPTQEDFIRMISVSSRSYQRAMRHIQT